MINVAFTIPKDTAGPTLARIALFARAEPVRRFVMNDCVKLTKEHINDLGPNKQNWPTTGFYKAVAKDGVTGFVTEQGFRIKIDHPDKPGAMRQRYYGGTISAKNKLLTIPARQEFYGHAAGEFSNLRFGMFASGTKFLYIAEGGTEQDRNYGTNKQVDFRARRGLGARSAMMIAYWLKESVTQEGNEAVVPTSADYQQECLLSLRSAWRQYVNRKL